MASSFATTASASAAAAAAAESNPRCRRHHLHHSQSSASVRLSPKSRIRFSTKGLQSSSNRSIVVKAQLNEVADGSSNAPKNSSTKSEVSATEPNSARPSNELSVAALVPEESVSAFISQVASLVKLVDSRDIVELQLKQLDCEVLIRKKEALPQPASSSPVVMQSYPPPASSYQTAPPAAPPSAPNPSSTATPVPSPPTPASAKSSLPPLKCPMAGTFYRSPAPGEPPFVKVGDKVKKGQVVCIIEAMKLMNEIEADQSGTVVDILAADGKPVSVDTPLLVIEP